MCDFYDVKHDRGDDRNIGVEHSGYTPYITILKHSRISE